MAFQSRRCNSVFLLTPDKKGASHSSRVASKFSSLTSGHWSSLRQRCKLMTRACHAYCVSFQSNIFRPLSRIIAHKTFTRSSSVILTDGLEIHTKLTNNFLVL